MVILIHSSKTMHDPAQLPPATTTPALLPQASELADFLATLSPQQIAACMKVSATLADTIAAQQQEWTAKSSKQRAAVESFAGDIYSGLQVDTWTTNDRQQADDKLRILSGLYGVLRPFDGIYPYRLELGYRLPSNVYRNLYDYWGNRVAAQLPSRGSIINLAAIEYSKLVTPFVNADRLITPQFLSVSPKTGQPAFVVVHAKIARGTLASWLIRNPHMPIEEFNEIGYMYDPVASTPQAPVFINERFQGLGRSVRLKHKT